MKPIEKRLIVVGGRYVGKTSMINALAKHAPETWQKISWFDPHGKAYSNLSVNFEEDDKHYVARIDDIPVFDDDYDR